METFILNTSLNYGIDVNIVRDFYNKYYAQGLFYVKLDDYIHKSVKFFCVEHFSNGMKDLMAT